MPDTVTNPAGGQDPAAGTDPQVGTGTAGAINNSSPGQQEPQSPTPGTGAPVEDQATQAAAALEQANKKLREENAARRKREQDLEAKVKAFEQEKLSDAERQEARLKELEQDREKLRLENRNAHAQVEAMRLGLVDPDAAVKLLDWDSVEQGTSVEDALKSLVESKPWLKAAANTPPANPAPPALPATNPARSAANPPIRLSQLDDPEFVINNQAEIARAYAEGRIVPG